MRNYLLLLLALVLLACQPKPAAEDAAEVIVGRLRYDNQEGAGCAQPDSLRTNCVNVELSWPNVEQGPAALKASVQAWVAEYFGALLAGVEDEAPDQRQEVAQYADVFIKSHREYIKENADAVGSSWEAESDWEQLLNNGEYLTLELDGYTFAGGAHGNSSGAIATFVSATGKQLGWADLVTDQKALLALAEKAFRAERADIFAPTDGSAPFEFGDVFQFALPANFGLVNEGIYFRYLPYEVGPYAIGPTEFVLPFAKLGALAKIQLNGGTQK